MATAKVHPTAEQRKLAKIFAMIVRNEMEDFHADHLSDAQMRELNPIVRNAICTALHMMDNLDNGAIAAFLGFHSMSVPDYWEEPELTADYLAMLEMTAKNPNAKATKRVARKPIRPPMH